MIQTAFFIYGLEIYLQVTISETIEIARERAIGQLLNGFFEVISNCP